MIPLVLQTLLNQLEKTLKNADPLPWVNDEPTEEDINHLLHQASDSSSFDPLNLRSKTLQDLRESKAKLITKRCKIAKVLAIVYPETKIPWELFSKIFQAFGAENKDWRIVWFASPSKRTFPQNLGEEPTAAHINGGYTYACRPDTVVIYREEEVARVLIHELLHAACTDNPDDSTIQREAKTESWAELFLVAIQTAGRPRKALQLWNLQAQWIADQEFILQTKYGVRSPENYAWRYTVARRIVLEGLGCPLPKASPVAKAKAKAKAVPLTLSFTHPSLS